jgi:hypothetical protein
VGLSGKTRGTFVVLAGGIRKRAAAYLAERMGYESYTQPAGGADALFVARQDAIAAGATARRIEPGQESPQPARFCERARLHVAVKHPAA